ncbi:hypothetical protein ESCO_003379 [Escovopsis weberi]|uniref:DUF4440 domain-containing protein n=1 Tax=Escovopsis weberi TaxID=150374 RepID=A0A0M8N8Z6_ESCWE|nr:hypothetical protein ESCO_003379 [Escovopsis weberi]
MPGLDDRMREDLLNKECALWTALTANHPGPVVKPLCLPDANLLFPQTDIIRLNDPEDFEDALESPINRFDNYELHDVSVIIIGLMAGVITYTVDAKRGKHKYQATGSSTWAQASDGEWRLAAHSETLL